MAADQGEATTLLLTLDSAERHLAAVEAPAPALKRSAFGTGNPK
jgi:hypothetical protein